MQTIITLSGINKLLSNNNSKRVLKRKKEYMTNNGKCILIQN